MGSAVDILGQDGTIVPVVASLQGDGWLDNSTVIGGGFVNFGYVRLNAPGTLVDIGFKGLFVGTVQQ